jgi:hypothetical protein
MQRAMRGNETRRYRGDRGLNAISLWSLALACSEGETKPIGGKTYALPLQWAKSLWLQLVVYQRDVVVSRAT